MKNFVNCPCLLSLSLDSKARGYVEENVQQLMADRNLGQVGVLQQLTVQENIDQEEVVNIITDLFLAAADTVSRHRLMVDITSY